MKIAVATEDAHVSSHFGRCTEYTIAEIKEGKLVNKIITPTPGHSPGSLPRYMKDLGVDCVITGGMGPKAQNLFTELGIDTIVGVNGPVSNVINDFIVGRLASGKSTCMHE